MALTVVGFQDFYLKLNACIADDANGGFYLKTDASAFNAKTAAKVLSASNIDITAPGATINAIVMVAGDRVVLNGQTDAKENGIWQWNGAASTMTRTTDANTGAKIFRALISIDQGTYADTIWILTNDTVPTIGTDNLSFATLGASYTADESTLHLAGTVFSIKTTYTGQSSITTLGTIATGVWNGTVVTGQYGGTGVANTGKTITLGGSFTTSGAFTTTLTVTGNTNVTLPTSGTLATTAQLPTTTGLLKTGAALDATLRNVTDYAATASPFYLSTIQVSIQSPVTTGSGATAGFYQIYNSLTTGVGVDISTTSITTGSLVSLSSTSTAAGSNTQTVLNVSTSGANGTSSQTTYAARFSNTHTGTSSVNVGIDVTVSGGVSSNRAITISSPDGMSGVYVNWTPTADPNGGTILSSFINGGNDIYVEHGTSVLRFWVANAYRLYLNGSGLGAGIIPLHYLHSGGSTGFKVTTSAAATLTLDETGTVYVFTGTTSTFSLPAIGASVADRAYPIKNRGSGNLTVDVTGGASTIYDTSAVASVTIAPGESKWFIEDGTYWSVL